MEELKMSVSGIGHYQNYVTENKNTKNVDSTEKFALEETGSTKELSEAEKLEAFKEEIWNEINSYSWNKSMNISIQITDGAFKRMMNDADFKDRMLGVIKKESIAAQPPGNVSLTWIDESGYKGYSYIDNDAGAIAFKAHSSDKDSFYVQKAKKNSNSADLTEYYEKQRREQELQKELRDKEYFQHKELTEYWNKRQSAAASYEANVMTETVTDSVSLLS